MNTTTQPLTEALNAQGDLEPGAEGYWQIWGAATRDIQPGDLLMVKWFDPERFTEHEVIEVRGDGFPAFITDSEGNKFNIGIRSPFKLFRKGTHHTLSRFCR